MKERKKRFPIKKLGPPKNVGKPYKWWKDKEFMKELDRTDRAIEAGEERVYTWEEVRQRMEDFRIKTKSPPG